MDGECGPRIAETDALAGSRRADPPPVGGVYQDCEDMKVKLILEPRLAKTWVHYDHELVNLETGEVCGFMKSESNWGYGDPPDPSFRAACALGYILSPDKKKWRESYGDWDWDSEVKVDQFNNRQTIASINYFGQTINIKNITITEVVVKNPVYIDPFTGIVWINRKVDKDVYSKRIWLFKRLPSERHPIWMIDNDYFYRRDKNPKTAFASGKIIIGDYYKRKDKIDHREFLYAKQNANKNAITKSAARHYKKIKDSIKPLSEATKLFFKTLGVFKHLKTQQQYKTQQKYAY